MRNKRSVLLAVAIALVLLSACAKQEMPEENDLLRIRSRTGQASKKVIMICVDSLLAQAIDTGIKQNKLPGFRFLVEHGQYYKNVVSSFPTMSVTIDSSLLTGTYPNEHRVPGLVWYSAKDKKLVNYGTGPMEIVRHGINPVLSDALIHLNRDHLNPRTPTVYEALAERGKTSGSINGLVYRGTSDHTLSIPAWLHVPTELPREIRVKGPDFLAFGAFSNPLEGKKNLPEELDDRLGFSNENSFEVLKYLIKNNQLPDFVFVYLPDMDRKLHQKGPSELEGVIQTDKQLASFLQAFGSREEALKEAVIMIVGDSGVAKLLPADREPVVELHRSLGRYNVLRPGAAVTDQTEIVLAVNETMAYVYKLKSAPSLRDMANILKNERGIDLLAWKEQGWIRVVQGGTSDELRYRANGALIDPYGQSWQLDNNPRVLDLRINERNRTIDYGQYPDVLQRLSGALHSHDGEFMVVAAKPGYELADRSSPTHEGGGGHGSLSKTESLIPLIIGGTDRRPERLRVVDIKAFLLDLMK